jgi:alpha-galactosidase
MNPPSITRRQMITQLSCLATTALVAKAAAETQYADPNAALPPVTPTDAAVLEKFTLTDPHLKLTQVILQDQTDRHNELVQTREWLLHPSETVELPGNIFCFENIFTGEGRILLKLEPLPHARPVRNPVDLRVTRHKEVGFIVTLLGHGGADSFVDLSYTGGAFGRTRVLQQFQRGRMLRSAAHRTPRFLSNTWGDCSLDSRVRHDFITKEIEAAARLGVEVVQIDGGWQAGAHPNESRAKGKGVSTGFWAARPDFWVPDAERFPNGLKPLAALAKARGIELGLWFNPDPSDDFANWEKDAGCLIEFYRDLGIRHFKIDGVRASTAPANANLRKFFATVLRESNDNVVFDLDVTASLRPGYYGLLGTGPLFVENRFTDWRSFQYWPHQTLRNLWELAWWVDPGRLRMEFLNNTRNADKYPNDPLAPGQYRPDALFAAVFFSNPLGWFEVSNLPPSYLEQVAPLVEIWKRVRGDLFSGTILPLGQTPDGIAWTGFSSVAEGAASALVLVFRELNPAATCRLAVPGFNGGPRARCEMLAGHGSAEWSESALQVRIEQPLGWTLLRLST